MSSENKQKDWLHWAEMICLFIVMVVVFLARCQSVTEYPIHEDELISFGVMQAIVSDGLPLTETGTLYWRSFSTYFLMAVPLFLLEPGMLAYRMVTILCSVLVLPVGYWVCRSAHGRLAAWLTVTFLALSTYQNLFAAFSRFYMPSQLFFLASVYFAGSYFIQRSPRSGWWLWFCIFLVVGSHKFAVLLLPVVLFAWLLGQRPHLWKLKSFWFGLMLLLGWCWLNWVWRPANVHSGSLALPLILGGLQDKLAFLTWFRDFAPGGVTLLILGVYPLLRERRPWWIYLSASFILCMTVLSLVAPADNPRYMIHLFPLGIILCCMSLAWYLEKIVGLIRRPFILPMTRWCVVAGFVVIGSLGYANTMENHNFPEAFGTHVKFSDQKPAHDFMSMMITSDAKIMSTDPGFTKYYLKRPVDFWLREQYDDNMKRYLPFKAEHKQGRPQTFFVDSPAKLEDLLRNTPEEIWLYANQKFDWGISPKMKEIVVKNFYQRYMVGSTYVFYRPQRIKPDAHTLP